MFAILGDRSPGEFQSLLCQCLHQSIITERGLQQHKRRAVDSGMIRSVTNEKFLHILYYPVVTGPLGKTKAVVEVCFNSQEKIPRNVLTNQI